MCFLYVFQASGGTDKIVLIWNAVTCIHLHTFKGHKDAVSVSNIDTVIIITIILCRLFFSITVYYSMNFIYYENFITVFFQGLVFQISTHELFSCSLDRTVKVWNVDELTYVETLYVKRECCVLSLKNLLSSVSVICRFGHQDVITSIDCLSKERPITAGGNDRTLRVWKLIEESQLVYNGHK